MSFSLTKDQVRNKTKFVTRRLGWWFLKPGDVVQACEQCQGLLKGQKFVKICQIRIVSTRPEPLKDITLDEVRLEGFPEMSVWEYIQMFTEKMVCLDFDPVNRIEFEYVEDEK